MLLDTCVVIDVLRGHGAALSFVTGLSDAPALSAITATELIAGVRNTSPATPDQVTGCHRPTNNP